MAAASAAGVSRGFQYFGGGVMIEGAASVPIFWEPAYLQDGTTPGYVIGGYEDGIIQFLEDMNQSRWLHTTTQYYAQRNGPRLYISDAATRVLRAVVDQSPYPPTGDLCAAAGHATNCISQAQIVDEISKVRAQNRLDAGLRVMYQVFTERDEATCFATASDPACSMLPNLVYCGYHDAFDDPVDGQTVIYSVEPYNQEGGCHDPFDTFVNSQDLDLARSILGHEVAEAVTDPVPSQPAWNDESGNEIADVCNFNLGPASDRDPGFVVNQVWNGHPYAVQDLWDLSGQRCAQAGPADAGGVPESVTSGAWTNMSVGSDPTRGLLVSKRENHPALDIVAQAQSPEQRGVFLLDHASDQLLFMRFDDPVTMLRVASLGMPISHQATSIAVTPDGSTALVTNSRDGTITTVDLANGTETTAPIGGTPEDVAVLPDGTGAWVADAAGSLRKLSLPGLTQTTQVSLPGVPGGVALSASGSDAYVTLPAEGKLVDVALAPGALRWSKSLAVSNPRPVVTASGRDVLTVDHDTGAMVATATNTGATDATVAVSSPVSVTATADGNAIVLTGGASSRDLVPITTANFTAGTPLVGEADAEVTSAVSSQRPVAAFTDTATTLGTPNTFDASGSHAQYGIASYRWSFGDGSSLTTTSPQATHTYKKLGTYTVTLTVTDSLGVSTTGTVYDGHEFLRQGGSDAQINHPATVVPVNTPVLLVSTSAGLTPVYESGPSFVGAPLGPQGQIKDFAVAPNGRTAYIVTTAPENRLTALDPHTGAAGLSVALPQPPAAIALAPNGATAYVAVADGIIPVDLSSGTRGPLLPVGGPTVNLSDLVLAPDGQTAWTVDQNNSLVYPVTIATGTVGPPVQLSSYQEGIAITPDGSRVLVPSLYSGEIVPIDTASGHAGSSITIPGLYPEQDTVTPDGSTLLATSVAVDPFDHVSSVVGVVDLATGKVANPITLGPCYTRPHCAATLAVMPDGSTAYAGVQATHALFPITVSGLGVGQSLPLSSELGTARPIPAQSPVAQMKATIATAGKSSTFNGAGSTSPNGDIVRWAWSFGDGATTTTTTPSVHHTYTKPGSYTVTLTVADSSGVSTTKVSTGHQLLRNGSAAAQTTLQIKVTA